MNSALKQALARMERLEKAKRSMNDAQQYILLDFSRTEGVQDIRFRIPIIYKNHADRKLSNRNRAYSRTFHGID